MRLPTTEEIATMVPIAGPPAPKTETKMIWTVKEGLGLGAVITLKSDSNKAYAAMSEFLDASDLRVLAATATAVAERLDSREVKSDED
jgi:hypothetical protein